MGNALKKMYSSKVYPKLIDRGSEIVISTPNGNSSFTREKYIEVKNPRKIVTRSDIDNYEFNEKRLKEAGKAFNLPSEGQYIFVSYRDLKSTDLKKLEISQEEKSCLLCLDEYLETDFVVVLPCKHLCHYVCLDNVGTKEEAETDQSSEDKDSICQTSITRCPSCELNLVRHCEYYKQKKLSQRKVPFDNEH